MKKSRILALVTALVMLAAFTTGCGDSGTASPSPDAATSPNADVTSPDASTAPEESAAPTETVKFKIGASPVPHALILEAAKDDLLAMGVDLEVEVLNDYIIPNNAVEQGDLDANYFQHIPFLDDFNTNNGTHLVSVLNMHYEPYAMYPGKLKTLDEMTDGAVIAVPSDPTNEARALQLLQAGGIIKLTDGVGLSATKLDIVENPKNIEIKELEAAMIPRALADVDYGILNGNYAIAANLNYNADGLLKEDTSEAEKFINVLVVKDGNQDDEALQKVIEVLSSDKMRQYIEDTFLGAVIPVF